MICFIGQTHYALHWVFAGYPLAAGRCAHGREGEVDDSREPLSGLVERVTFHSPEIGFCVLRHEKDRPARGQAAHSRVRADAPTQTRQLPLGIGTQRQSVPRLARLPPTYAQVPSWYQHVPAQPATPQRFRALRAAAAELHLELERYYRQNGRLRVNPDSMQTFLPIQAED
jgi:hypothetical protein